MWLNRFTRNASLLAKQRAAGTFRCHLYRKEDAYGSILPDGSLSEVALLV
jgi:hypothetical protein